jgi:hypothetical protein
MSEAPVRPLLGGKRLWLAFVCSGILASTILAGDIDQAIPRPTGGFIQLPPPWYRRVYQAGGSLADKERCLRSLWERELRNLKAIGLDTVVVQYSATDGTLLFDGEVKIGGTILTPDRRDIAHRSIGAIMEQAGRQRLDVWLGLRFRSRWNSRTWASLISDPGPVIEETLAVARGLKDAGLLESDRFAGWYITPEIGNARVVNLEATRRAGNELLRKICAGLRAMADRPVAISGFYRTPKPGQSRAGFLLGHLSEPEFLDLLDGTLAGSGVRVLIFQDGVGVEDSTRAPKSRLSSAEMSELERRFQGIIACCNRRGITPWADLELMVGEQGAMPATSLSRLQHQCQAARGFPKLVVFATSHYMTALGGARGSDRLFEDYFRLVTRKT